MSIIKGTSFYRKLLEDRKSQYKLLSFQKVQKEGEREKLQEYKDNLEKAKIILSLIGQQSQTSICNYIESLVTMMLNAVYDDPFKFLVIPDIKRKKSEVSFRLYEGDSNDREIQIEESFIPESEEGGGICSLLALSLRIIFWSLQDPRSTNVLLFDEPFGALGNLVLKMKAILRELSEKLQLQVIIITHNEMLKVLADKTFLVEKSQGKSAIREISNDLD